MPRPRPCVSLVLAVWAAGVACAPRPDSDGPEGDAPCQAIVIVVDTLRRDALGCYGAQGDPTPHMDALAAAGTRFEQAISASGWTLPSVASLLTGTWPAVHRALGKKARLTPISADVPTAAELLGAEGFATGAVANAAFLSPMLGLERGFDVFDHRPAFNRELRRAVPSVDAALDFAAAHRGESFFLLVHLFDPHLDYDPPAEYAPEGAPAALSMADVLALCPRDDQGRARLPAARDEAHVRAMYAAEVRYVDAAVGRLLDALDELGLRDEALVVLTADHGEEFWEHRGFEHGHSLYDELVRVPLIVDLPRASGHEVLPVVESQVRVLDVMPTVFDVFELELPASFVGQSLLAPMRGATRADRPAFCDSTLYGSDQRALRGERYKYLLRVGPDGTRREELYDWRTDPGETRDLAARDPERLAVLRAAFAAFEAELEQRAASTRPGAARDVTPETAAAFQASLESLGYVGREDTDDASPDKDQAGKDQAGKDQAGDDRDGERE